MPRWLVLERADPADDVAVESIQVAPVTARDRRDRDAGGPSAS
jgi:hypothetical protein